MRTNLSLLRECCLTLAFLIAIPHWGQTIDASCFRARSLTHRAQGFTFQATASDTLELTGMGTIYAMSIDAIITQPREASFARIVLEDTEGHDYLVAESDRFRNDTTTVLLSEYCEETAQLRGITPRRLKCYLAGDAALNISNLHISTEPPTRGDAFNEQTRAAIREAQVQDIVERINEYNRQHGKLWRAGVNSRALMEYGTQDDYGETDAYIANFKYYTEGIYDIGERVRESVIYRPSSIYPESCDWRYRHGRNGELITEVKDQVVEGPCIVFAAVGAVEAVTNLYFNQELDLDLSEKFVGNESYLESQHYNGNIESGLLFIRNDSVIDEDAMPYDIFWNIPILPRPIGSESITFCDTIAVLKGNNSLLQYENKLKKALIDYGPGICGIKRSNSTSHVMTLVGYDIVKPEDYYTFLSLSGQSEWIPSGNIYIGSTFFVFKDSYGHRFDSIYHHDGYRYILFNDTSYLRGAFFLKTPIVSRNHSFQDIYCEDRDGDGYFNWGIGERPNSLLPVWAELEEDWDDSNDRIGYWDGYGNLISNDPSLYSWLISSTEVVDIDRFSRGDIDISSTGTLIVRSHIRCQRGSYLTIASGGSLVIDGGIIDNVLLFMEPGSNLTIINEGKILLNKKINNYNSFESQDYNLEIPVGASVNIQHGSIEYRNQIIIE